MIRDASMPATSCRNTDSPISPPTDGFPPPNRHKTGLKRHRSSQIEGLS